MTTDITPAVLRNKGYLVRVHRLAKTATGDHERPLNRVQNAAEEFVYDELRVKFTNMILADIEDRFGSIDDWQTATEKTPYKATIDTLAIVWQDTLPDLLPEQLRRIVGAMLIDDEFDEYASGLGACYMLAQGAEADDVVRVLASGIRSARDLKAKLMREGVDAVIAQEAETMKRVDDALRKRSAERSQLAGHTPTSPGSSASPSANGSASGSSTEDALASSGT